MKRLIVKISGGLGNQLFTYAAAKRLAMSNSAELVIDHISGFENDSLYKRKYILDLFNIPDRKASWVERLPNKRLIKGLLHLVYKSGKFSNRKFIFQEDIHFDSRLLNLCLRHNISFFQGYWQSEKYYKDIEPVIREILRIKVCNFDSKNQLFSKIKSSNSISVHIRFFEDKLDSTFTISEGYYLSAMQHLSKQLINPEFFIFSDKPHLLNDFLLKCITYNFTVVNLSFMNTSNPDLAEFELMSVCKHNIIANSTFSWWAAWLGTYEGKIVIAPKFETLEGVCAWGFEGLLPGNWIIM